LCFGSDTGGFAVGFEGFGIEDRYGGEGDRWVKERGDEGWGDVGNVDDDDNDDDNDDEGVGERVTRVRAFN